MNQNEQPTINNTQPTRVRFARPRCFCGHVAAAIYPEVDEWSEPTPLTANWVYECHYTPKQDGMVAPDHCYGCDEELARALRARDVYDRGARGRGPGKESGSNVGTMADYYNPNNVHNISLHPTSPKDLRDRWINPWTSSYGNDTSAEVQPSPISPPRRSLKPSWADTARKIQASWSAQPLLHNSIRGDQLEIYPDGTDFDTTDDTPDLYTATAPESFPSTSTWGTSTARRTNTASTRLLTYADMDASFFATATPVPNDTVFYQNSSTTAATANRAVGGTTADGKPSSDYARKDTPLNRVKVCGFHMHAMEWRKIQSIGHATDEILGLAERAQCPKFNLSVTRWLDRGFNHLELEPFNTVKCYCGKPLIVAKENSRNQQQPSRGRYELVCRARHEQTIIGLTPDPPFSIPSPRAPESCSMVIPINKVKYRPLLEPVHRKITPDEWLSRFFKTPTTFGTFEAPASWAADKLRPSLKKKKEDISFSHFGRARMTSLKALTFKDPVSETIHLPAQPPVLMTAQDFGTDGWIIPKQMEERPSLLALRILRREIDMDISDPVFSERMEAVGVQEMPRELVVISAKAAIAAGDERLRVTEERLKSDIRQFAERQARLDIRLDGARNNHASTVQKIRTMEANAQLLPDLKCRVCYERQIKFAILPCHHMVLCTECAKIVESCIVCRGPKLGTLRVDLG
ncbi:hypothetical protein BGX33_000682 [Mortierella sp. NVP41]|nr:hypothetical protein BGX33_000682 [Mortierella sp. NVP41]